MTGTHSTFWTAKAKLFITIVTAISLLSSVQLCSALDFTFDSPDSVNFNQSFTVVISAQTDIVYDVKIVVLYNSSKVLSETLNDGIWRSSHYFILSSFPQNSEYKARVFKEAPVYNLCIRLRLSNQPPPPPPYSENCKLISLNPASSDSPQNESASENSDEESESSETDKTNKTASSQEQETESENSEQEINSELEITSQQQIQNLPPKVASGVSQQQKSITLSSGSKVQNPSYTKEEKTQIFLLLGFTLLCALVLLSLMLKKL